MVLVGGAITSVILLLVVFAAIQFRFKRLAKNLKPCIIYDIALSINVLAILALAGLAVKGSIAKYQSKSKQKISKTP